MHVDVKFPAGTDQVGSARHVEFEVPLHEDKPAFSDAGKSYYRVKVSAEKQVNDAVE